MMSHPKNSSILRSLSCVALLAAVLSTGSSRAAAGWQPGGADDAAVFERVLHDFRTGQDHSTAIARLHEVGPEGTATLLGILSGSVQLEESDEGPILTPSAHEMMFQAARSWPADEAIAAAVDWLGHAPASRDRLLVLELLGEVGERDSLHPFFKIVAGIPQEEQRHPAIGPKIEGALTKILRRDGGAHQVVIAKVQSLDHRAMASVARATADACDPAGVHVLEKLMGRSDPLDVEVLAALGNWNPPGGDCSGHGAGPIAATYLNSNDARVRQQAAVALGKLQDTEAVPALVATLQDPDRRVVKAAHWALTSTVGGVLPADFEVWSHWLASEAAWFKTARESLDALLDPAPGAAQAAMRDLAAHPLYRAEFVTEITAALRHEDANIAQAACGTLARLGGRCPVEPLIDALTDGRPQVRSTVAKTLAGLTGESFGEDQDAWRAWLNR